MQHVKYGTHGDAITMNLIKTEQVEDLIPDAKRNLRTEMLCLMVPSNEITLER